MNTELTALTRPRMASGISSCTRVWRTTTLTVSAAPDVARASSDNQKLPDRPNTTMHKPNKATAISSVRPTRRRSGQREHARHTQGTHGRSRTQQTQATRTDLQDVAREHRQQGGRTTGQHGEQIQRHRTQQNLALPNVGHACQQRTQRGAPGRRRHMGVTQAQQQEAGNAKNQRANKA